MRDLMSETAKDAVGGLRQSDLFRRGRPRADEPTEIVFDPADERRFKEELLRYRRYECVLYFGEMGAGEISERRADKMTEATNIRANITSSGYWRTRRETGLTRVTLSVIRDDDVDDYDEEDS